MKRNVNPFKLFRRDWKDDTYSEEGTRGFCFNLQTDSRQLLPVGADNFCFDFSIKTGSRVLIYVKDEYSPLLLLSSLLSLSSKNVEVKSKSLERLITKYHKLQEKSLEELKNILIKCQYTQEELSEIDLRIFKILFFLLCKERFDDDYYEEH